MNQTDYVLLAYLVAFAGIGGVVLWAYLSMRSAESAAEALKR